MKTVPKQEAMDDEQTGLLVQRGEDTPAYEVLRSHGLLNTAFRLPSALDIDAEPGNATRTGNLLLTIFCGCFKLCDLFKTFEVDSGHVKLIEDGRGGFAFAGTGVHRICDPFYKVKESKPYSTGCISHGDMTLVVVEQGHIGFVLEKGNPILLPPGLHQWKSATMQFIRSYDLNNNILRMGPLTLVTVDSGYSAVTEDNGRQRVLQGGATYLLTHRNWKFQKYVSLKIQSDNLKRIEATSADNVLMAVDATVIWRIVDVEVAAMNSVETIAKDGGEDTKAPLGSVPKLANDVLKQAEASLAAFIGAVNYSDTFNVAAAVQKGDVVRPTVSGEVVAGHPVVSRDEAPAVQKPKMASSSPLFDLGKMQTCLDHANAVTITYGVKILSINVVSAVPADRSLMVSLAQGAVAAAEAQKFETVAAGKAAANKIEAQGIAEAQVLRAHGEAEAETLRAEGHKKAAELLSQNQVAVSLATIDRTGAALGDNKAFFFGAEAKDVGALLATSVVADAAAKSK